MMTCLSVVISKSSCRAKHSEKSAEIAMSRNDRIFTLDSIRLSSRRKHVLMTYLYSRLILLEDNLLVDMSE